MATTLRDSPDDIWSSDLDVIDYWITEIEKHIETHESNMDLRRNIRRRADDYETELADRLRRVLDAFKGLAPSVRAILDGLNRMPDDAGESRT